MARVQPWMWLLGMLAFSIPTHVTGLLGMPRRVYDPSYADAPLAQSWKWLTDLSAVGGLLLFASAMFFALVMLFTVTAGKQAEQPPVSFAEPLEPPGPRAALFDRLGLWTVVAVILIVVAYGYPIWSHLRMATYGSPGFSPF